MPTANSTLSWTLLDGGPVPETFTPTCTTASATNIWIAYSDMPDAPFIPSACVTNDPEYCWPTPTNIDNFVELSYGNSYLGNYWSGVKCPTGWTSVGQAVRPTNGPVTSSGSFRGYPGRIDTPSYNKSIADFPIGYGWQDALGAILDPGETAVACCPSGLSDVPAGMCHTIFPSATPSTACVGEWPKMTWETITTSYMLNGSTYTGPMLFHVPTSDRNIAPTASSVTTFPASQVTDLVAVSQQLPLYLVHKGTGEADAEAARGRGGSGGTTETNAAAARFYTRGSSPSGSVWGMLGVLGISALAGALLILPV